jgi:hypothetical protein
MVRKWSYLSNPDDSLFSTGFRPVKTKYVFKVFRQTTRFKKFILFPTVFFRKKDSIRKRKTNWLTLSTLIVNWAKIYSKYRSIIRFHQNLVISQTLLVAPEISLILKRAKHADVMAWNSSALTSKGTNYLKNFEKQTYFFKPALKFSKVTNVYVSTPPRTESNSYLSPSFQKLETVLYQNNILPDTGGMNMGAVQTNQIYKLLTLVYRINVLLTLFNTRI